MTFSFANLCATFACLCGCLDKFSMQLQRTQRFAKGRRKGITGAVCLVLLFSIAANAQDTLTTRYGIYIHDNLNFHAANFQQLPGVPNCCPRFETGFGSGIGAGAMIELPLNHATLFSIRASLHSMSGVLSAVETTTVIINNAPQAGEFTHTVDASIMSLGIEPLVSFRLLHGLFVSAGAEGAFVVTKSYSQQEQITKPDGVGTFVDAQGNDTHSRTRNAVSGSIPTAASFVASLVGGISYEVPMNSTGTLIGAVEGFYHYPLGYFSKDLFWKVSSVSVGIAVKYCPRNVGSEGNAAPGGKATR